MKAVPFFLKTAFLQANFPRERRSRAVRTPFNATAETTDGLAPAPHETTETKPTRAAAETTIPDSSGNDGNDDSRRAKKERSRAGTLLSGSKNSGKIRRFRARCTTRFRRAVRRVSESKRYAFGSAGASPSSDFGTTDSSAGASGAGCSAVAVAVVAAAVAVAAETSG